jgi:hypothetical protein
VRFIVMLSVCDVSFINAFAGIAKIAFFPLPTKENDVLCALELHDFFLIIFINLCSAQKIVLHLQSFFKIL